MIEAFNLGGFFAAHALWSLVDDIQPTPILAHESADGKRAMARFVMDDLATGLAAGSARLASNDMNAINAAFVYDGRVITGSGKIPALIIEMKCYAFPGAHAALGIPYVRKSWLRGLRIHRPKMVSWDHCDDFGQDAVFDAFMHGLHSHEKGAEIWKKCFRNV